MSETSPSAVAPVAKTVRHLTPDPGWFHFDFKEVWEAREIVVRFVQRDLISSYKQTVLGPMWLILPPIFTSLMFTVVFGKIAKIPTDGMPPFVFYMLGNILWTYFAACVQKTSATFLGHGGIFGKVYFPRLTVPISVILFNLVQLFVQFGIFFSFYLIFKVRGAPMHMSDAVLWIPLVIVQLAALGLGIGCLFSAFTVKYRDLNMMLGFGLQLWMYGSCTFYTLSSIHEEYRWIFALNPIVPVIEFARYAFFGTGGFEPAYMFLSAGVSLVMLFVGLTAFKRMEANFMDSI